jgi:hypothetical protein
MKDAAPTASRVLERTKSSLFGRFEPVEGLPPGPFKVCAHGWLGLIGAQHHEVITYTLIENRVRGLRSQLESFELQARNGEANISVTLPCAAIFKCDPEKIFVLLSGSVSGLDSTRVRYRAEPEHLSLWLATGWSSTLFGSTIWPPKAATLSHVCVP